jgi:tetratricopeptide (TPR) repeat protein
MRYHFDLRTSLATLIGAALFVTAALLGGGCASKEQAKVDSPWAIEIRRAHNALASTNRDEADRFFLAALQLAQEEHDQRHLSATLGGLALLRYSQGRLPEAEAFCSRQIDIDRDLMRTNKVAFAEELARFAELEETLKKYTKAEQLYGQAQELTVSVRGTSSPMAGVYLAKRAHLYVLLGKKEQAEQFYKRSLNFLDDSQFDLSFEDNLLDKQHRIVDELARIRAEYAQFCEQEGRLQEAARILERAISSLETIHGKGCPQATPMFESLDRIQKQLKTEK